MGPVPAPSGASSAVNDPQGEEGAEEPEHCAEEGAGKEGLPALTLCNGVVVVAPRP